MPLLEATCATLLATLASAPAQSTVRLARGASCEEIIVRTPVAAGVRLEIPKGARIASLRFLRGAASGLTIAGGGDLGAPGMKYGLEAREATGLTIADLTVQQTVIGIAIPGARNPILRNLVIRDITRDGISSPRSFGGYAENIRIEGGPPSYTTCTFKDGRERLGLARRACEAEGGVWKDQAHRDGWQIGFRQPNGSGDWVIRNVTVDGPMRGIAGNVDRVDLRGFSIRTKFAGAIQFTGSGPFIVRDGELLVWRNPATGQPEGHRPRIIVGEPATVCGIRLYPGARQTFPPCRS
ncbi:hypothetical protein [Thermaurantiacus sp.]